MAVKKTFEENLRTHIQANVPVIYIETSEMYRCADVIKDCCESLTCKFWNQLQGLDGNKKIDLPVLITKLLEGSMGKGITVLEYADKFFGNLDNNTQNAEVAIDFAIMLKSLKKHKHQIIIVSPKLEIPIYIQKEVALLDFPLPSKKDIKGILADIREDFPKISGRSIHDNSSILDAVRGLGTTEIRNAFAKVAVDKERITSEEIPLLIAEKEQIIRKSGHLEFCPPDKDIDFGSIGGLKQLKDWLEKRQVAFDEDCEKYKLNVPKGVLLLGVPGTGKSLSAKAVARLWNMPLLRLDMGRIFGGLVGESESNMRNAIRVAESMEPCVLWIDEIEKGLSSGAGGERDGGTSSRVFGSFLTWMQEKAKKVFVFATANNIEQLPPELLRKGRFDEIFFVDLPNEAARKKIFQIHLQRKEQLATGKKLSDELLDKTEGFSGAEIESIVNEALFMAVAEAKNKSSSIEISSQHLIFVAKDIVPLSSTMKEDIDKLREWAAVRCQLASEEDPPKIGGENAKQTPKLPQEVAMNWIVKKGAE